MNPADKQFKISGEQIRRLVPNMGGCYASDRITVDGCGVGYMFREQPKNNALSGWTFMSGNETQEYADNPNNWAIYEVNTICNYDPAIAPYLQASVNTAFGRKPGTDEFIQEPFQQTE